MSRNTVTAPSIQSPAGHVVPSQPGPVSKPPKSRAAKRTQAHKLFMTVSPAQFRSVSEVSLPKRTMRAMLGLNSPDKVYQILQHYDMGYVNSGVTNQFGTWNFTLNAFPNYTAFTTIFDQYRIHSVEVEFIPTANAVGTNASSLGTYPVMLVAADFDDTTNWTTEGQALSYENLQIEPVWNRFKSKLTPHVNIATTSGGVENVPEPWIDTASAGVPHYGLKYCLTSGAAAALYPGFRVFCRAVIELKNVF
jgi:hypothetical protein